MFRTRIIPKLIPARKKFIFLGERFSLPGPFSEKSCRDTLNIVVSKIYFFVLLEGK